MSIPLSLRSLGNFLILASLAGFVYLLSPLIRIYFFPVIATPPQNGPYLTIPKIHALAPIILNVDSQDPKNYLSALKRGVAHAQGTALPGTPGNVFLFAHSSDYPWNIGRYNTVFFRLNELEAGDEIRINTDNQRYVYQVVEKKIVSPYQSEDLSSQEDRLVIQTCYPPGTAWRRLLIFAKPQS